MTISETIIGSGAALLAHFARLAPEVLALNLLLTAAVIVAAALAGRYARRLLRAGARSLPGSSSAERTVRTRRAVGFVALAVRLVLGAALVSAIAAIWGVGVISVLAFVLAQPAVMSVARVALILVGAVIAWEVSGFLINQALMGVGRAAHEPRRLAQLRTLTPLARGLVQGVVAVMAVLMVLGEAGVKIGPLLAGAGVVGVALGFGAQTLVKDFLTGVFLIIEDIVSVGDIVRIGDSGGLVEEMTLRTIRLRDFDGTLHIFPYSEAQVVHNLTKSFSYYVFDLQISYGSDIGRALEVMRQTGADLARDAAFADKILEPIEVVGVDNLGERGVALKARIKTRPIEQWNVGREYNRRIKEAFDREGVQIPYPHLKIVLPEPVAPDAGLAQGARA